jgi:hypothetical protein
MSAFTATATRVRTGSRRVDRELRRRAASVFTPSRRTRARLRKIPGARHLHAQVHRWLVSRRRIDVPVDRLLVGGNADLTGAQYAELTGDLLAPSRRIEDSSHVSLLRAWAAKPNGLDDVALRSTEYVRDALTCVDAVGDYFGARSEDEVLAVAREFATATPGSNGWSRPGRTPVGGPIRVRRLRDSDCFQVVDGHHRLARAVMEGTTSVAVELDLGTTTTPVQDLLDRLSWTEGRRELYQPVAVPEIRDDWQLVRRCDDRLAMMREFLEAHPVDGYTSLDVGSCYGWFVAALRDLGYIARGIERDPAAVRLGEIVYGLEPGAVAVGDCVEYLRAREERAAVVTCFSVLHHFAMGRGGCSAEELAGLLDDVTGEVLFFDTGQAHEAWFRTSLPEWTPQYVEGWLREHTSFSRIIPLGVDQDAVPPFQENYGRTLFACVR